MGTQDFGNLQVRATTANLTPIAGATVNITDINNPDSILAQMVTNEVGLTEEVSLPAPPIDYSLEPSTVQPYAVYDVNVIAENYRPVTVNGTNILPNVSSSQSATLVPEPEPEEKSLYVIPPHTLFGEYPPKIAEDEIKATAETGEIVLQEVVIPEFIIVHDGPPTDTSATNHYVRFRDYIKNVACSEVYATWPESSIYANVLAILSFTLNRVFTEWYRSQGFNFTITSSTAFDQKWMNGRNIFNNIGLLVDSVFVNYLSRPNVRQPILTQYCDGNRVQCPGWMQQWGSKQLGDQGYEAIDILRNYYGNSIFINTARQVSGVPASWPGSNLTLGTRNDNVRIIQSQLNTIAQNYPAIPTLAVDGVYGPRTSEAVRIFQQIFDLPTTGVVDFPTWYKISFVYTAVARLAE
ncbi:MAG: peptidoglycan-binding protein [Clostridiales bacterium]|nr:peptidoglycan-binding protein [Clostridiales bacterium]